MRKVANYVALFVLAVSVASLFKGGGGIPILDPTPEVDRVVYVYEIRDGAVPPAVLAGINELKRSGIDASSWEDDVRDADGEIPDQYRGAAAAASETGTPVLVALAGDEVVRTVKAPTEKAQVLGVINE